MITTKHDQGFTIVELLIVVVVISILAAITVVAYNGISKQAKLASRDATISQWKQKSEVYKVENGIECPANYAFVYANPVFNTPDFCVMQYEAKNVSGVAQSQAAGLPWTLISQAAARSVATVACDGCHLITENEWMAIVANVLSVKYNWSGTEFGSGYVYGGHNDNSPSGAVAASTDDKDGYFNTNNSESSGENQKRTYYLTSGDTIWDISGNVSEWTDAVTTGAQPGYNTDNANPEIYSWHFWNSSQRNWNTLPYISRASTLDNVEGILVSNLSSAQGLGRFQSNQNQTDTRAFRRGGYWNNGSFDAGLLSLSLNQSSTTESSFVGFRVVK